MASLNHMVPHGVDMAPADFLALFERSGYDPLALLELTGRAALAMKDAGGETRPASSRQVKASAYVPA